MNKIPSKYNSWVFFPQSSTENSAIVVRQTVETLWKETLARVETRQLYLEQVTGKSFALTKFLLLFDHPTYVVKWKVVSHIRNKLFEKDKNFPCEVFFSLLPLLSFNGPESIQLRHLDLADIPSLLASPSIATVVSFPHHIISSSEGDAATIGTDTRMVSTHCCFHDKSPKTTSRLKCFISVTKYWVILSSQLFRN